MSTSEVPIWKVHPNHPDAGVIAEVASVIRKGGVVVYPTETFYGLGAHPALKGAIDRIYRVKGREFNKPLPLIASDRGAVRQAVSYWPEAAERLAQAFWPGPLTLILPASAHFPPMLHAGTGRIAVRISSHAVAQRLAEAIGGLLIATSANKAGDPPCKHPDEMIPSLIAQTDGLLDGGKTSGHLPSTIVDISELPHQPARLIRAGALPWEKIETMITGANEGRRK